MAVKRVGVYTAVFDGHDTVAPQLLPSGADYHCFTDDKTRVGRGWDVHELQMPVSNDGKLSSLSLKTRVPDELKQYECVLWVDGHVRLHDDPAVFVPPWLAASPIAVLAHPSGGGLFDELYRIKLYKSPADFEKSFAQYSRYRSENSRVDLLPVYATGVLARKPHDPKTKEFGEAWWKEIHDYNAPRDQMSFSVVLDKLAITPNAIQFTSPESIVSNRHFCLGTHAR